jgi:hypothetical protein
MAGSGHGDHGGHDAAAAAFLSPYGLARLSLGSCVCVRVRGAPQWEKDQPLALPRGEHSGMAMTCLGRRAQESGITLLGISTSMTISFRHRRSQICHNFSFMMKNGSS